MILSLLLVIHASPALARPVLEFPISKCEFKSRNLKYAYGGIKNEVVVTATARVVPRVAADCSDEVLPSLHRDAQSALERAVSMGWVVSTGTVRPVRCGTISHQTKYEFVLVESALSPIPESVAQRSLLQIYSIMRSTNGAREVFSAYLEKQDIDLSENLMAVCGGASKGVDSLVIEKRGKGGWDYQILHLHPNDGALDTEILEGGWGD